MSTPEERNLEQIKRELILALELGLAIPRSPYGGEILHSHKDGVVDTTGDKRRKGPLSALFGHMLSVCQLGILEKAYTQRVIKLRKKIEKAELVEDWMLDEVEALAKEAIEKL